VRWILLGKGNRQVGDSAIGYSLFASAQTPFVIEANRNPATGASGMILEGPFPDCPHRFHYHGTLLGRNDGGGDCGWGATAGEFGQAQAVIEPLSEAIVGEQEALNRISATPPQFTEALDALAAAREALATTSQAIRDMAGSGELRGKKKGLQKPLRKAGDADGEAFEAIARLSQQGQGRPRDLHNAQHALRFAISMKQEAFLRLVRTLRLL
jgi:hypothetical protein